VEDDPLMQSVLGKLLEDEGYVVTRAPSGDAGLRAPRSLTEPVLAWTMAAAQSAYTGSTTACRQDAAPEGTLMSSQERGRRFRFGVSNHGSTPMDWQRFARHVEDLGFSTLVISDHFGTNQLAPLPALMAAGAATSTLRLAAIVLNNDFRHPAVMAKEAATVDVLTGGRLELGLGAGWELSDYTSSGITFGRPRERLAKLTETIRICKALFTGEAITFRGDYYQIDNLTGFPLPLQKPHPPIMIGGRQRQLLSLAAREANIIGVSLIDAHDPHRGKPPPVSDKIAWIRAAAGSRFDELELQVNAPDIVVTDQPRQALEEVAARRGLTVSEVLESPAVLVGSSESIIERLFALRERYGLSYFVVPARSADAVAKVVAHATGR
jgi:probable F420-dependent oxidoreductase